MFTMWFFLGGTPRRLTSREAATAMENEIGAKILRPLVDHTVVAGESLKFRIRGKFGFSLYPYFSITSLP